MMSYVKKLSSLGFVLLTDDEAEKECRFWSSWHGKEKGTYEIWKASEWSSFHENRSYLKDIPGLVIFDQDLESTSSANIAIVAGPVPAGPGYLYAVEFFREK